MITEALQKLTNTLGQVQDRRRKIEAQDTMMLLGTKFVDDIQGATDTTKLSSAMLNANKISFALGVPELASQINNLGQIKMQEIAQGKSDKLNEQKATVMRTILKDQKVLIGDEYTTLGTTQEFKQIESMEPALQADAYKVLADHHRTQIVSAIDTSGGMNKSMLKRYAIGPNGEQKLVQEIKPTESGFMSYLTGSSVGTPTFEPAELVEFKSKLQEYQWKKKEEREEFNYRQSVQKHDADKPKLQQVQFSDGSTGFAVWAPAEGEYGRFHDTKTGKDITDNVVGKGYKDSSTADDLKRGDVVQADSKRLKAAWEVLNQLIIEGKVSASDVQATDMSGQNKPNAIAALVSLNANGQLEKWKNESKTLRPVIENYYRMKEHAQKVTEASMRLQEEKINKQQPSSNQSGGTIALPKLSFGK